MTHQKDDMDTKELAAEVKRLAEEVAIECVESARAGKYGKADSRKSLYAAIDRLAALASKPDAAPARSTEAIHPCGRGYMLDLFDDYADATAEGYWDERAAEVAKRIVEAMTGEMQEHGDASSAVPAGGAEALRELFEVANDIHGSLDKQTYDEKRCADWNLPDDHAYDVRVTAAQERALSKAIVGVENARRAALAAAPVVPPQPDSMGASPCGGPGSAASGPSPSVSALRAPIPGAAVTDEMVTRFLGWPLPKTFAPDCGITFDGRKADAMGYERQWPIGTNLLTAVEARAMLEHVLGGGK